MCSLEWSCSLQWIHRVEQGLLTSVADQHSGVRLLPVMGLRLNGEAAVATTETWYTCRSEFLKLEGGEYLLLHEVHCGRSNKNANR